MPNEALLAKASQALDNLDLAEEVEAIRKTQQNGVGKIEKGED
jgi:hypothetical protein